MQYFSAGSKTILMLTKGSSAHDVLGILRLMPVLEILEIPNEGVIVNVSRLRKVCSDRTSN